MAGAYVKKKSSIHSRWGTELAVHGGRDAEVFGFSPTAPNLAGADELRYFGLANVSYRVPLESGLTVQAGIFTSLIGYDSLYAKDNSAYTRPWGADFTPYLMTGVNASYSFTDRVSATLFVVNGYWHLADANHVPSSGAQLAVTAAPGASAALMALTVSGLPTDRFFFEGFLPARAGARRARIAEITRIPATLVLFESGARVAAALADLADGLGARQAAIARELTKLHEEVRRGTLDVLARDYAAGAETRGEFAIVIAPPDAPEQPAAEEIDALLRAALARISLKDAVAEVAAATGEARRAVYSRALALTKDDDAN